MGYGSSDLDDGERVGGDQVHVESGWASHLLCIGPNTVGRVCIRQGPDREASSKR